jgi:hypothetical protein
MRDPGQTWKNMRLTCGVALVVAMALLVAGCGGTKTLSHSALITKANAACQQANSAVSKLGAPTASLSALTGYATKVLPISQQLVTKLAALKPASGDQSSLNSLVSALKNGNRGLKMMSTATTTAQTTAANQIIIAQSVPKAATTLGATTCASSPSAS